MPELPEVQTVVDGLNLKVRGRKISNVWTNYFSNAYIGKESIKDKKYFRKFKKKIIGQKILKSERRAKYIIIHLSGGEFLLIHLKMTGHLIYGNYKYSKIKNSWIPEAGKYFSNKEVKNNPEILKEMEKEPTRDPFNKYIHFVLTFKNGKELVMSDVRKFASVKLISLEELKKLKETLGPEPLKLKVKDFIKLVRTKGKGKAKTVLMNPRFIAGIGNIYSDEILWKTGICPESSLQNLSDEKLKEVLKVTKKILKSSIDIGGDSMSDFRNIDGRKGKYQANHNSYKLEGTLCKKKGCNGIIKKKLIGQRVGRFCPTHQKMY